jgi:hypothetical protein
MSATSARELASSYFSSSPRGRALAVLLKMQGSRLRVREDKRSEGKEGLDDANASAIANIYGEEQYYAIVQRDDYFRAPALRVLSLFSDLVLDTCTRFATSPAVA